MFMKRAKITYKVTNDEEHAALLQRVDALMRINEANTTREQRQHIRAMAEALMAYEQSIYEIPESRGLLEIYTNRYICLNEDIYFHGGGFPVVANQYLPITSSRSKERKIDLCLARLHL